MHPDNLNATIEKPIDEQGPEQSTEERQPTEEKTVNLAALAADYKVRHPRFSAPANVDSPEVDLTTETVPEPEVPKEEQKLYLTETGSSDSTKKTWRDSSYTRLYVMGGIFACGAVVVGLMFNMKLPNVRTASVSMSDKRKAEETKEPEFAGDGDYAAQAALSAQDGAYGAAQKADGHGYGGSKVKPNLKHPPHSKVPVVRSATMPPVRRASLPSTMAYNAPVRRSYNPPTDNIPAYRPIRRSAPVAIAPPSAAPAQPKQSAEERRLAAIAATSSTGVTTNKGEIATVPGAAPDPAAGQNAPKDGYQEAAYLPSETAVLEGIPQQLINRSQKAKGRLLLGVAFTPGDADALNGQPVEIEIKDPLQSGLPAGARIVATVDLPKAQGQLKNAPIRLIPSAIAIGDAEYPLPKGVVILTGKNGKPLIAKRQGSEFLRNLNSTFKTLLGGGLSGLSTLALGNGTGILSSLGGANALSGLTNLGKGNDPQQATEILALRENTAIQINIVKPLSLPATQADLGALPESVSVAPGQASGESVAISPEQPMMFKQDLSDAELMAIATHQESANQQPEPQANQQPESQANQQPEQPQQVEPQGEVQDAQ
jgi:hypothetical protein